MSIWSQPAHNLHIFSCFAICSIEYRLTKYEEVDDKLKDFIIVLCVIVSGGLFILSCPNLISRE